LSCPKFHSAHYKIGTHVRCKDTYEPTIQQSSKSKTPEELHQAQKSRSQGEESREVQASGLSANLSRNQKAVQPGGFFIFAHILKFFKTQTSSQLGISNKNAVNNFHPIWMNGLISLAVLHYPFAS
jgi:hypothetical protein